MLHETCRRRAQAYDFFAPGFAEDKLARLAARLRAANPSMALVFYYNANLDLTDYRLCARQAPFLKHYHSY